VLTRVSWLIPAAVLFSSQAVYAQHACENLVNLTLPYTLITAATSVPEGVAPAPAAPGAPPAGPGSVPAHCDVRGVIRPSGDSNIKFALWLPATSAWNAKYRQEGNGGWAGAINTASFAEPLRRGYAVAGTDNGHEGGTGADWAIGHPEKLIDLVGEQLIRAEPTTRQAPLKGGYAMTITTVDATVNAIGPSELTEYLGLVLLYIALGLTAGLRAGGRPIAAAG
jgi:hypothetical protein